MVGVSIVRAVCVAAACGGSQDADVHRAIHLAGVDPDSHATAGESERGSVAVDRIDIGLHLRLRGVARRDVGGISPKRRRLPIRKRRNTMPDPRRRTSIS